MFNNILVNKMGNPASKSSFQKQMSGEIDFVQSGMSLDFMKKESEQQVVLTKFTWHYGGNDVILKGTFNNWKKGYVMERQGEEFSIFLQLPRDIHQYKFLVDGTWRFSPEHPTMPDSNGHINNYIDTRDYQPLLNNEEVQKKKEDEHSGPIFKDEPSKTKYTDKLGMTGHPPKLLQHYERCLYLAQNRSKQPNMELGQNMWAQDSKIISEREQKAEIERKMSLEGIKQLFTTTHSLPMPTHITLDHIMTQQSEDYTALSITQRCKQKYTTYTSFKVNKAA